MILFLILLGWSVMGYLCSPIAKWTIKNIWMILFFGPLCWSFFLYGYIRGWIAGIKAMKDDDYE